MKLSIKLILGYQIPLNELQNKLPDINQLILIRQLRELEQDKIIERTVYPLVSPKVAFSICNWGDEFLDTLKNKKLKY
ncbi:winged helix-turn-helix transcriptional regulator [Staphylococcus nepalensis]|nr:winged helix-turn-helix transcriptional regulator [Staphylococcus nepalensis]MBO1221998.1 winged helix-turn-helix transcriptional regulator [Staphylococcus nepalensis]